MSSKIFIAYKNSSIACLKFGNGSTPVVCFHGYAEEASGFAFLETPLGKKFTFYCIDLPFHGETNWNEGLDIGAEGLKEIVDKVLDEKNAGYSEEKKIILAGFSLGGRIALSLYELMPERIEKLVLLAPDGLKENFWYWLATQTKAGNRLFSFTMKHPGWFFGLLKVMNKTGFVNASIFKFVNYYIHDLKVRELLYKRWTGFRKLRPSIPLIKKNILRFNTEVRLVYGKHDRIIMPSVGERFKKGIEAHVQLLTIRSGHQVLHEKHADYLLPAFLN